MEELHLDKEELKSRIELYSEDILKEEKNPLKNFFDSAKKNFLEKFMKKQTDFKYPVKSYRVEERGENQTSLYFNYVKNVDDKDIHVSFKLDNFKKKSADEISFNEIFKPKKIKNLKLNIIAPNGQRIDLGKIVVGHILSLNTELLKEHGLTLKDLKGVLNGIVKDSVIEQLDNLIAKEQMKEKFSASKGEEINLESKLAKAQTKEEKEEKTQEKSEDEELKETLEDSKKEINEESKEESKEQTKEEKPEELKEETLKENKVESKKETNQEEKKFTALREYNNTIKHNLGDILNKLDVVTKKVITEKQKILEEKPDYNLSGVNEVLGSLNTISENLIKVKDSQMKSVFTLFENKKDKAPEIKEVKTNANNFSLTSTESKIERKAEQASDSIEKQEEQENKELKEIQQEQIFKRKEVQKKSKARR